MSPNWKPCAQHDPGDLRRSLCKDPLHARTVQYPDARRLQAYSFLWFSEDTQNEAALNLRDRLDRSLVDLGNRILFFEIWFKDLPERPPKG